MLLELLDSQLEKDKAGTILTLFTKKKTPSGAKMKILKNETVKATKKETTWYCLPLLEEHTTYETVLEKKNLI